MGFFGEGAFRERAYDDGKVFVSLRDTSEFEDGGRGKHTHTHTRLLLQIKIFKNLTPFLLSSLVKLL